MAAPHNVVRINGSLPGGEVWSVNPRFIGNFGDEVTAYADLLAWAQIIAQFTGTTALGTNLRSLQSTVAPITSVRTEYRDETGVLREVAEVVRDVPYAGTGSPNKVYQTAVVCSLRTGRPGRSYRGRIFWPCLSINLDGQTLRIAPTQAQAIANEMAAFLTGVGEAAPTESGVFPAVVSQTLGTAAAVTSVQVGNVVDIQRRRRDALQETVYTATVPPPVTP